MLARVFLCFAPPAVPLKRHTKRTSAAACSRCKPLKHKGKMSLIVNLLRCKSKEKHVKGYYVCANI